MIISTTTTTTKHHRSHVDRLQGVVEFIEETAQKLLGVMLLPRMKPGKTAPGKGDQALGHHRGDGVR